MRHSDRSDLGCQSDCSFGLAFVILRGMRIRALAALAVLPILAACNPNPEQVEIADPGRVVAPSGGNGIVLASEAEPQRQTETGSTGPELKARLPAEYIPSQAIDVNLDLDET